MNRVISLADVANALRPSCIATAQEQRVAANISLLQSKGFSLPPEVQKELVKKRAKDLGDDPDTIVRVLLPWSIDGSPTDGSDFDGLEPALARTGLPSDAKAACFVELLATEVLATMLKPGPSRAQKLFLLADKLMQVFSEEASQRGSELEVPIRELWDFLIFIKVLQTPDPSEAVKIDPDRRARHVFAGKLQTDGVQMLMDGIAQNEDWNNLKKSLKVSIVHEMTLGPQMVNISGRLDNDDETSLLECLDKLSHWQKVVRVGGTAAVEAALVGHLRRRMAHARKLCEASDITTSDVAGLQELEGHMVATAALSSKFAGILKEEVARLAKEAKDIRGKCSVMLECSTLVGAIDAFIGASDRVAAMKPLVVVLMRHKNLVNESATLKKLALCLGEVFSMIAPPLCTNVGSDMFAEAGKAIDLLMRLIPSNFHDIGVARITGATKFYTLIYELWVEESELQKCGDDWSKRIVHDDGEYRFNSISAKLDAIKNYAQPPH